MMGGGARCGLRPVALAADEACTLEATFQPLIEAHGRMRSEFGDKAVARRLALSVRLCF
jgi:hypothetical protein